MLCSRVLFSLYLRVHSQVFIRCTYTRRLWTFMLNFTKNLKVTILIQATKQCYINVLVTAKYLQNSTRTNSLSVIPVLKLSFVKTSTPSSFLISSQHTIVDITISKQTFNIFYSTYFDQRTQRAPTPSLKKVADCLYVAINVASSNRGEILLVYRIHIRDRV